ncbi:MAG: hypothetical protein KAG28_08350 [Cocleimonas sp.]|nr:hypothetical protein [Cocleimonas sp.]
MTHNETKSLTDEELFHAALINLKYALLRQSRTQRRVTSRVRTLIRSVVIGLGSALMFILYLVFILTQQVNSLSSSLDDISKQAILVQDSMDDIDVVMLEFDRYMKELPGFDASVTRIENNMMSLTNNVSFITQNITEISREFVLLNGTISGLGGNTLVLNQVLQQVTLDVLEGTKPARRFNSMNPFNFIP